MFPTLQDLLPWSPPIDTHSVFATLGLAVAGGVFLLEWNRRTSRGLIARDHRIAYVLLGAMLGAALFARLGTWLQNFDFSRNLSLIDQLLYGNASILAGLVGAWIGAWIAKLACGYRERTGDMFAPAVAIGMVIGRIGCLLTERPGTPTGADWGIVLDAQAAARLGAPAGVPLHPSFVYEIAFHLVAFAILWFWLRKAPIAAGETLTLYVAAYGIFRFFVEFVRGNELVWLGLSRPQWFLLLTVPLLLGRIFWKARSGRLLAPRVLAAEKSTEAINSEFATMEGMTRHD